MLQLNSSLHIQIMFIFLNFNNKKIYKAQLLRPKSLIPENEPKNNVRVWSLRPPHVTRRQKYDTYTFWHSFSHDYLHSCNACLLWVLGP